MQWGKFGLSVGNGVPVAQQMPRRSGNASMSGTTQSCRITGRDMVQTLSVSSAPATGDRIVSFRVNPSEMPALRLNQLQGMYQRWHINGLRVVYEPACPTTTVGSIIAYYDYDVMDAIGEHGGSAAVQQAAAHIDATQTNVWSGACWSIRSDAMQPDYYTGQASIDPHWDYPGSFNLIWQVPATGAASFGTVYLEYDITFQFPQCDSSSTPGIACLVNGGPTGVSADAPFGNNFTQETWANVSDEAIVQFDSTTNKNYIRLPPGAYTLILYKPSEGVVTLPTWEVPSSSDVSYPTTVLSTWNPSSTSTATVSVIRLYTLSQNGTRLRVWYGAAPGTLSKLLVCKCPSAMYSLAVGTRSYAAMASLAMRLQQTLRDHPETGGDLLRLAGPSDDNSERDFGTGAAASAGPDTPVLVQRPSLVPVSSRRA